MIYSSRIHRKGRDPTHAHNCGANDLYPSFGGLVFSLRMDMGFDPHLSVYDLYIHSSPLNPCIYLKALTICFFIRCASRSHQLIETLTITITPCRAQALHQSALVITMRMGKVPNFTHVIYDLIVIAKNIGQSSNSVQMALTSISLTGKVSVPSLDSALDAQSLYSRLLVVLDPNSPLILTY